MEKGQRKVKEKRRESGREEEEKEKGGGRERRKRRKEEEVEAGGGGVEQIRFTVDTIVSSVIKLIVIVVEASYSDYTYYLRIYIQMQTHIYDEHM